MVPAVALTEKEASLPGQRLSRPPMVVTPHGQYVKMP